MNKQKIFISSVQREFFDERKQRIHYCREIRDDKDWKNKQIWSPVVLNCHYFKWLFEVKKTFDIENKQRIEELYV